MYLNIHKIKNRLLLWYDIIIRRIMTIIKSYIHIYKRTTSHRPTFQFHTNTYLALQCCSWGEAVGVAWLCGRRTTSPRRTETNHLAGGPWRPGEGTESSGESEKGDGRGDGRTRGEKDGLRRGARYYDDTAPRMSVTPRNTDTQKPIRVGAAVISCFIKSWQKKHQLQKERNERRAAASQRKKQKQRHFYGVTVVRGQGVSTQHIQRRAEKPSHHICSHSAVKIHSHKTLIKKKNPCYLQFHLNQLLINAIWGKKKINHLPGINCLTCSYTNKTKQNKAK